MSARCYAARRRGPHGVLTFLPDERVALTAEPLIVIGRGQVLPGVSVAQVVADAGGAHVAVLLLDTDITVTSTGALGAGGPRYDQPRGRRPLRPRTG